MPRSNVVRPLFALERSDHVLFRVRNEFMLRLVFNGEIAPVQDPKQDTSHDMKHGRTLVMFIHGVGGSLDVWQHQMKACRTHDFDVLAVDLLGHGGSSKPHNRSSYCFNSLANDLIEVFDAHKQAVNILVGHSYGASFCTFIAVERSSYVQGLVMIAGGSPTPLLPETCSMFSCPLPVLRCIHAPLLSHYKRMAFYTKDKGNPTLREAPIQVSPFVLHAIMHGQVWPESTTQYHSNLALPVLLLAGRQDGLVSIAEEEWMHEVISGSQLNIIDDAGHMVIVEKPDAVNGYLLDFIRECVTNETHSRSENAGSDNKATQHQNGSTYFNDSSRPQSQLSRNWSLNSSTHSFRKGKVLL